MQVSSKEKDKVAKILFAGFLIIALWMQFSPQPEPGTQELAKANLIMKSSPTPEDIKQACALYAASVKAGNKTAAIGLSDCVRDSQAGSEASRKALRYMLLTHAIGAKNTDRKPDAERKALGLTMDEINEARKINIMDILNGKVTSEDLAGAMPVAAAPAQ